MDYYHNFLIGIVIICPKTNKQIAMHKNNFIFKYWDAGLAGDEVDVEIEKCQSCGTRHTLTLALSE